MHQVVVFAKAPTTLFNAALLSGLDITQVRNHSKTSSYVPRGRDAMVNDSDSDFKFTNNFNHPVYISAYAGGGQASVKIYGSSQDKVSVSIKLTTLYIMDCQVQKLIEQ